MAKSDSVSVFIYDEIGAGFFSEGVTLKSIQAQIAANPKASNINVYLNTPGGDVLEGYAIYNYFKGLKDKAVNMEVVGMCASIGTLIASAGTGKPKAPKNSRWLVHNPFTSVQGDADTLIARAEELRQMENDLVNAYISLTGKGEDEIKSLMKENRLMTAEEAAQWGFVELKDEQQAKAYFNFDNKKENTVMITIIDEIKKLGDLLTRNSRAKALATKLNDGTEIFIDTENPNPSIGDKVFMGTDNTGSPASDGDYTLEDGTVITVASGAITTVTPLAEDKEDVKKLKEEVMALQSQLAEANAKAEDFKAKAEASEAKVTEKETVITEFSAKYQALVKMAETGAPLGDFKKVFNVVVNPGAKASQKDNDDLKVFDTLKKQLLNF